MVSNMQTITRFELLPNEIFIECFDYLNVPDIYYSFYRLNYRLKNVIKSIPLQLNFGHVRKTLFDDFCKIMVSDSDIKKQIYSLRLSNIDTCGQIQTFFSIFSLDEFPSLRSLALTGIDKNNSENLKLMFPLLLKSCSVHVIEPDDKLQGETRIKPIRKLLGDHSPLIFQIPSITHLTLCSCACRDLSQLFTYAPMLRYLNVRKISGDYSWTKNDTHFGNDTAVHLKQLIMMEFSEEFQTFQIFVEQIPNLRNLMIISHNNKTMVDALRWEELITSSLPLLKIFKFEFSCYSEIWKKKHEDFQSDFWQEQHQWYIEYSYYSDRMVLYTMPYTPNIAEYSDLSKRPYTLHKITDLTLSMLDMTETQAHLENVTTLKLTNTSFNDDLDLIIPPESECFESLKKILNLFNLQHLVFPRVKEFDTSGLLLKIFKHAPQLSSLQIHPEDLQSFIHHDELRKYLNKMIKKLDIVDYPIYFTNDDVTEKFCETFSNLEQLSSKMTEPYHILLLLKRLSKLSTMTCFFDLCNKLPNLSSFEAGAEKLDVLFSIKYGQYIDDTNCPERASFVLSCWTGDNTKELCTKF